MAKKYYWLQMKEDFFRQKEIKMLRKIAGGDTYTIIYQKMLLMSLRDEGKILYEGIGASFAEEISLEIDEEVENVQVTINYLISKKLMRSDDADSMFMNDVPNLIGSESDSAKRVRRHRQIKKEEQKALQCNADVTSGNTEIEIELEKDIDIEQEQQQKKEISDAPAADDLKINPHTFYQEHFGIENPTIIQTIDYWVDDLNKELVIEAMRRAALNESGFKYAEGIMKNWDKKGFKTMDEVKAEDISFENKKSRNTLNKDSDKPISSDYEDVGF